MFTTKIVLFLNFLFVIKSYGIEDKLDLEIYNTSEYLSFIEANNSKKFLTLELVSRNVLSDINLHIINLKSNFIYLKENPQSLSNLTNKIIYIENSKLFYEITKRIYGEKNNNFTCVLILNTNKPYEKTYYLKEIEKSIYIFTYDDIINDNFIKNNYNNSDSGKNIYAQITIEIIFDINILVSKVTEKIFVLIAILLLLFEFFYYLISKCGYKLFVHNIIILLLVLQSFHCFLFSMLLQPEDGGKNRGNIFFILVTIGKKVMISLSALFHFDFLELGPKFSSFSSKLTIAIFIIGNSIITLFDINYTEYNINYNRNIIFSFNIILLLASITFLIIRYIQIKYLIKRNKREAIMVPRYMYILELKEIQLNIHFILVILYYIFCFYFYLFCYNKNVKKIRLVNNYFDYLLVFIFIIIYFPRKLPEHYKRLNPADYAQNFQDEIEENIRLYDILKILYYSDCFSNIYLLDNKISENDYLNNCYKAKELPILFIIENPYKSEDNKEISINETNEENNQSFIDIKNLQIGFVEIEKK